MQKTPSPVAKQQLAAFMNWAPPKSFVKAAAEDSSGVSGSSDIIMKSEGKSEEQLPAAGAGITNDDDDVMIITGGDGDGKDDTSTTTTTKSDGCQATPMAILNKRYPQFMTKISFEELSNPNNGGNQLPAGRNHHFVCRLQMDGQVYTGEGLTKKEAKQAMAKTVLAMLPPPEDNQQQQKSKNAEKAATANENQQQQQQPKVKKPVTVEAKMAKVMESAKNKSKHPMQVLRELIFAKQLPIKASGETKSISPEGATGPDARYVCVITMIPKQDHTKDEVGDDVEMADNASEFLNKVYESDQFGTKKLAQEDAAKKALHGMFDVDPAIFDAMTAKRLHETVRGKPPVQAMREMCTKSGLKVEEESHSSKEGRMFTTLYKVNEHTGLGESTVSKAEAKRLAAIKLAKVLFDVDLSDETLTQQQQQLTSSSSRKPATTTAGIERTPRDASFSSSGGGGGGISTVAAAASAHPLLPPLQLLRRIAEVTGTPYFFEQVSSDPSSTAAGYHQQYAVKGDFGKASVVETGGSMEEAKTNAAVRILREMGIEVDTTGSSGFGKAGGDRQEPLQQPQSAGIIPPPPKRHAPEQPMGSGPSPLRMGTPSFPAGGGGIGGWARNNYNEVLYRQGKQGYW